jgi:hypothetical protein
MNGKEEQIILGSLMGDGNLRKECANVRFQEGHSLDQTDYLLWKFKNLKSLEPKIGIYKFITKRYGLKQEIKMWTRVNTILNDFHNLFYKRDKKIITIKNLNKLDILGLLIWYLDDGTYYYSSKNGNGSIRLGIKDKTIQKRVQKWFKKRYKLDFRYDTYGLRLCKNDTNKFLKMVKPVFDKFKLPISLNYKLGKDLVRRDNQHKNRMEYQNTERIKKREEFLKEHKQNCLECDKEFPLTRTDKKFCSRKCKNKFNFHKFVLKQKKVKK